MVRPVCTTVSLVGARDSRYGRVGRGSSGDVDAVRSKDVISAVDVKEVGAGRGYVRELEVVAFSQDSFQLRSRAGGEGGMC